MTVNLRLQIAIPMPESAPNLDDANLALSSAMTPGNKLRAGNPCQNSTIGDPYPDLCSLTRGIRRGEELAFTRFYNQYGFRIYKQLLYLSRGDEAIAREVCQSVAIKLTRRFEVFHAEPALWAWLCRVARNELIDFLRKRSRHAGHAPMDSTVLDVPDETACESHLIEPLRLALKELTPEDRELLQSFYVDEHSTKLLAATRGETPKAVESRLGRLRQKVKESLLNFLRDESK